MQVYFGTSPRIKERYEKDILRIYDLIEKLGYKNNSDFVLKVDPKKFYKLSEKVFNTHHQKTIKNIHEADICIFEASLHSLSVGYLVNYSIDLGKPVIVLSRDEKTNFLFRSVQSDKLFFIHYNEKNLGEELKNALEKAKEKVDIRFNFFITPQLLSYMDWLSNKRRIPRSVFIRNLIEKELKADLEYKKEMGIGEEVSSQTS